MQTINQQITPVTDNTFNALEWERITDASQLIGATIEAAEPMNIPQMIAEDGSIVLGGMVLYVSSPDGRRKVVVIDSVELGGGICVESSTLPQQAA